MRTEDGHIIHKCINGEPEAFGFLVDKYKESIYAFAYTKLGNFHDAEDITQEVFIKAFRKLNTLKSYDSLSAWLYAITSNLCKDFLRSKSKRPDQDFIEDSDPNILDNDFANSYREDLIIDLLHDALDTLPKIYRQVLVLHYLGNMNSFEIADFTGIAHSSVRTRLTRARDLLKKEMLEMMTGTFDEQRLRAGFTFNIVETIKKIRINPISITKGLPLGLSLAMGAIFTTFMFFGASLPQFSFFNNQSSSLFHSEMKVLKNGDVPVDILKSSSMAMLSNQKGNDKKPDPDLQNAFFLAPQVGEGTWTRKGDIPFTLSWSPACEFGGKIYIFDYSGKTWEYDPLIDTYQEKSIGNPGGDHDAIVLNGKIYVTGHFGEMSEYDPIADKWTRKASAQFDKRGSSLAVLNGKIYAIGGATVANTICLSVVQEYEPAKDSWTRKRDLPLPLAWNSVCTMNDKIYVFGGWNGGGAISTVMEYDPNADKWTKKQICLMLWYSFPNPHL
jgi:RNA polymerase sigma factor (sigma-70 family)